MFDKRLVSLAPGAFAHVIKSVLCKWVALLCNIGLMAIIGLVLGTLVGEIRSVLYAAAFIYLVGDSALVVLLGIVAALILVRALAVYLAQREGDKAAFLAVREVRQRVYDKLAELGPAYAEHVSTAEAVQTSVEGAQQLEVYFGGYMAQLFYAVLAPLTLFAFLVWQAGLASAVLLIMVPIIPISIMMVMRNAKVAAAEYWDSYVDLGGAFLEALQGLTTLKIYSADAAWHEHMNEESEGFRGATMKLLRVQLRSIMVMDLVAYAGAALGIIIAVVQLAAGSISFSAAFLVVYLAQEFFLPMRRLGSLFHTAMNGMAAANTMYEILDTPVPERGSAELDGAGDIELVGVGYAYGEPGPAVSGEGPEAVGGEAASGEKAAAEGAAPAARQVVLADVSLTLPKGSFTAIVGASGSGKSTLAGILAGRKEAYQGEVRVGGVELREATRESLSRTVTLVPTDGHLFEGTVRENLCMAAPEATDDELWAALESCQLAAFVRSSGGLDLALSEGGANLSGGQRQRLCVARALLHKSPIYVFDEATSNVDVESEQAIGRVIEGLVGDHTVVVVAHRLASIVAADRILVLDGGRVVEQGAHAELVAAGGVYAALWESQRELSAYTAQAAAEPESEARARAAMAAAEDAAAFGGEGTAAAGAGKAATAEPAASEPAHRSGLSIMWRMVKLVRPLAKYLVLAIALGSTGSLAATFVMTFGGYGLMEAIGVASAYPLAGVIAACLLCGLCGIVRGPLHYGEQLANHYIAFRLLAHIRDLVFGAFRRLAPAKLEGRDKGDLVSLVTADIGLLEVFYAHTISPIAIALVTGAVMLVFIGSQSWVLALIALAAYLVVGVVLPLVSGALCGTAGRESRDGAGALSAYVLEGLRGLSETIQYGQSEARSAGLRERTDALGAVDTRLKRRSAAVEGLADALVLVFDLVMLCAALLLAIAGQVEFSSAFVCAFAFFSSFGPMLAVARLGTSLQNTLAAGARVLDLLDEEPQTRDVEDGVDVVFDGAAVEGVSFAYGAEAAGAGTGAEDAAEGGPTEQILSEVSIEFPAGQMVCITGRSGSGKSTLLKLLMRFWDVDAGRIALSGEDVRRVNTASLRAAEGYLTQETHLFVGTLGQNLRIARADATDEELDAACEAASILDLVRRLPAGYDTPVGELGSTLSGGERQRIGLARVFLHDAPFILLDEPTSALDALNEAAVMRAIDERRAGKTIVLVSHRASTCAFADKFYSVEHGRLS